MHRSSNYKRRGSNTSLALFMPELHPNPESKRVVTIHVTFHKIGEINTKGECFDADVLILAKWREPTLDKESSEKQLENEEVNWQSLWNPRLFIENAIGEIKERSAYALEYPNGTEAFVVERWRCKSTFYENLELFQFPFDVQDLSVNVMSELHSSNVTLKDDPESVHIICKQSFTDKQEWHLYKYIESHQIESNQDKVDPLMFRPSLLVTCRAARRPAYFIWNVFSVTFLISCLAVVTFSDDNPLDLSFTLLLTTVAFKFVVNQSLPEISYLTYLDRYVLANMVLITCVSMWHGIQKLTHNGTNKCESSDDGDNMDLSHYKNRIAMAVYASAFILYNIFFTANIVINAFTKRRKMNKLEQEYIAKVKELSQELAEEKKKGRFARLRRKQRRHKPELDNQVARV